MYWKAVVRNEVGGAPRGAVLIGWDERAHRRFVAVNRRKLGAG